MRLSRPGCRRRSRGRTFRRSNHRLRRLQGAPRRGGPIQGSRRQQENPPRTAPKFAAVLNRLPPRGARQWLKFKPVCPVSPGIASASGNSRTNVRSAGVFWSKTPFRSASGIKTALTATTMTRNFSRSTEKVAGKWPAHSPSSSKAAAGSPVNSKAPARMRCTTFSGSFRRATKSGSTAQQNQPVDARENTKVQQAVAQIRRRKNFQWPAVKTAVADQNQFARGPPGLRADSDFAASAPARLSTRR